MKLLTIINYLRFNLKNGERVNLTITPVENNKTRLYCQYNTIEDNNQSLQEGIGFPKHITHNLLGLISKLNNDETRHIIPLAYGKPITMNFEDFISTEASVRQKKNITITRDTKKILKTMQDLDDEHLISRSSSKNRRILRDHEVDRLDRTVFNEYYLYVLGLSIYMGISISRYWKGIMFAFVLMIGMVCIGKYLDFSIYGAPFDYNLMHGKINNLYILIFITGALSVAAYSNRKNLGKINKLALLPLMGYFLGNILVANSNFVNSFSLQKTWCESGGYATSTVDITLAVFVMLIFYIKSYNSEIRANISSNEDSVVTQNNHIISNLECRNGR